jgi:hypothetical protein
MCGWSCGGDPPMHSNSLTPTQISETQRSFLNFRIDSSYYGAVDMENLGYTARRSTTAGIRMRRGAAQDGSRGM